MHKETEQQQKKPPQTTSSFSQHSKLSMLCGKEYGEMYLEIKRSDTEMFKDEVKWKQFLTVDFVSECCK